MGWQGARGGVGTGPSSLAPLTHLDGQYRNPDSSLVRGVAADTGARALFVAVIAMAHRPALRGAAAGVETADRRKLLALSGGDFGRGYVYAQALPADQFTALAGRGLPPPAPA